MSFQDALRVTIANELNRRFEHNPSHPCYHPNDIADIEVRWDDGDRSGLIESDHPHDPPTFELDVETMPIGDRPTEYHRGLSAAKVFTALLRELLRTEL